MRSFFHVLAVLLLIIAPAIFTGCDGAAAVPGSGSESSEAADAAGGMNKTDGPAVSAPKADAPTADAPKGDAAAAPAGEDKKPK